MRVTVLALLTDSRNRGYMASLCARSFRGPFLRLVPQVLAAWYRQLGLAPVLP